MTTRYPAKRLIVPAISGGYPDIAIIDSRRCRSLRRPPARLDPLPSSSGPFALNAVGPPSYRKVYVFPDSPADFYAVPRERINAVRDDRVIGK